MKKIISLLIALGLLVNSEAQEFRIQNSPAKIIVNLSGVLIEGYDGRDIVISKIENPSEIKFENDLKKVDSLVSSDERQDYFTSNRANTPTVVKGYLIKPAKVDSKAIGLKMINGRGLIDNTGLGLLVDQNEKEVTISQISKNESKIFLLKVPRSVNILCKYDNVYFTKDIILKNLDGEIEVSAQYNSIKMENLKGPVVVNSVYGNVDVSVSEKFNSPISLRSVYGYVDLTIPKETKSDFSLLSVHGDVLVSPSIRLDLNRIDVNRVEEAPSLNSRRESIQLSGKINGGGASSINLKSTYGRIYLRTHTN